MVPSVRNFQKGTALKKSFKIWIQSFLFPSSQTNTFVDSYTAQYYAHAFLIQSSAGCSIAADRRAQDDLGEQNSVKAVVSFIPETFE